MLSVNSFHLLDPQEYILVFTKESIFGCCFSCISLPCDVVALCLAFTMAAFNHEYTSVWCTRRWQNRFDVFIYYQQYGLALVMNLFL